MHRAPAGAGRRDVQATSPPPSPSALRRQQTDRLPQHRLQPVPTEQVAAFSSLHPHRPPTFVIKLTSQKPEQPLQPMRARFIYSSELKGSEFA